MSFLAKWFFLLNKRLYKKTLFVVILIMIPLVVFALSLVAKEESGFLHIALAQEDFNDSLSNESIDKLMNSSELLRFTYCNSPLEAENMVKTGKADTAWIFFADLDEKLTEFSKTKNDNNAVARVVEREQNVLSRLAREKLSGVLFAHLTKKTYIDFSRQNISELDDFSDKQLLSYYDAFVIEGNLFEFGYPDSDENHQTENENYLVTPVRGLLSVLVVLGGLATSLFYLQDEKKGTFSWVSLSKRPLVELICQLISTTNLAVAMLISLLFAKLNVSFLREILIVFLFILSAAMFSIVFRQIFNNIKILTALIPLSVTLMIAVCPVFFSFNITKQVQMLFPTTYYINAVYNNNYIFYMIIYILVLTIFSYLLRIAEKRLKTTS